MNRRLRVGVTFVICGAVWGSVVFAGPVPRRPRGQAAQAALADPLDGATFVGDSGPKGKPADERDELSFADGRFHSKACDQYGFAAAPYKVTKSADGVSFEAVTHSDKEGTMAWKGQLTGATLEGNALWTKPGQPPYEYWFKATRR